jgi:hypothetical protein
VRLSNAVDDDEAHAVRVLHEDEVEEGERLSSSWGDDDTVRVFILLEVRTALNEILSLI